MVPRVARATQSSPLPSPPDGGHEPSREHLDHRAAENTRLLKMAEEMAAIGHWHLDLEKDQLIWSDEVYRIHGLDPAEFEPRPDAAIDAYHPDDRAAVASAVTTAIEERGGYELELRIVRPDDTVRHVISSGKCLTDEDERPVALFGVIQDVTENKYLGSHRAKPDRTVSLGTMAAGIAHEINNPLTSTIGALDLVVELARRLPEVGSAAELQQLAHDAIQGAERVAEIARRLKKFSHPELETAEGLRLDELVEESIRMSENHIRHRARLTRRFSAVPPVKGGATDLTQVFTDLLVNAAQAIPLGAADDHMIQVSIDRRDGSTAVVEISDTGEGTSGTGPGLSICRGLVSGLGGTIEIDSPVGEGTRVRVVLPLAERAVAPEPTTPPPSRHDTPATPPSDCGTAGRAVLVIDDEDAIRTFVTRALHDSDARAAENGAEAIRMIEEGFVPDHIICDLMMPTMTGREVHEELGRRWPDLQARMIFATGGTFTNEMTEWLDGVNNRVLNKPFRLAALRGLLDLDAA